MKIDFVFRTYRSFGPDASLALATIWVESRLAKNYGGRIKSVIFECCCRNDSIARKTLERRNADFEKWLLDLPMWEVVKQKSELRVCYVSPRYKASDADEERMLSVDRFYVGIKKAAEVLSAMARPVSEETGIDAEQLASDLAKAASDGPRTLDALVSLYIQRRSDKDASLQ